MPLLSTGGQQHVARIGKAELGQSVKGEINLLLFFKGEKGKQTQLQCYGVSPLAW